MRTIVFSCVALLLAAPAIAQETVPPRKKVLIIGIDGCRPDALLQARIPHLTALILTGAFSDKAQTGDITVSGPGWSSMLTGVWREKHGIRDNSFAGANLREFPHFFRRLKEKYPKAVTVSIVHWGPVNTHILSAADVAAICKDDKRVTDQTVNVLRTQEPDVVFVHFDEVDGAGHRYGFHPKVPQYLKAIEQTDGYVGRLMQAVQARKTYAQEDWLILVSTDHGGSGRGHGRNIPEHRTIFLIVSGPSARKGKIEPAPAIVDIAATALAHLGVLVDPRWQLDGRPVGLRQ
jgi:predicted AlkP superfamily pyrophosphatase or phosphodiesterase